MTALHQKALTWAAKFDTCCYLDSNENTVGGRPPAGRAGIPPRSQSNFDILIAAGTAAILETNAGNAFSQLKDFQANHPGELFGFFSYDLKNEVEQLHSRHPDHIGFPDMLFFKPKYLIRITGEEIEIEPKAEAERILRDINQTIPPVNADLKILLKSRFTREEYFQTVQKLRAHIEEGDIYEVNLCQEFYATNVKLDPASLFIKLNEKSKAPFSGFLKHNNRYLLCASPERFIKKEGSRLISQPIKGTIKRGANEQEDNQLKEQLRNDLKERAENVMIVDLVRNDLSRVCTPGTVQVDELFGIYTFPQVHHMISTISGELKPDVHAVDGIKHAFPMGSMTGAPKVRAMELIEQYERTRRGVYSGALGYINGEGDFDFNVVIRSMLYNAFTGYLSYQVGGAITYDSVSEKEYEECLLKAKGMREVLGGFTNYD